VLAVDLVAVVVLVLVGDVGRDGDVPLNRRFEAGDLEDSRDSRRQGLDLLDQFLLAQDAAALVYVSRFWIEIPLPHFGLSGAHGIQEFLRLALERRRDIRGLSGRGRSERQREEEKSRHSSLLESTTPASAGHSQTTWPEASVIVFRGFVPGALTPARRTNRITAMSALPELPLEDEQAAAGADALRLIEDAEILGIPWRRILKREILAEGMLQRFLGSPIPDLPLWQALSVIPNSLFHSWRVRDLLDSLCHEAAAECSQSARRELAYLLECLSGPRARSMSERAVLSRHYRFAYDRAL